MISSFLIRYLYVCFFSCQNILMPNPRCYLTIYNFLYVIVSLDFHIHYKDVPFLLPVFTINYSLYHCFSPYVGGNQCLKLLRYILTRSSGCSTPLLLALEESWGPFQAIMVAVDLSQSKKFQNSTSMIVKNSTLGEVYFLTSNLSFPYRFQLEGAFH